MGEKNGGWKNFWSKIDVKYFKLENLGEKLELIEKF